MLIEITKILAIGANYRYMWIKLNEEKEQCIRIPDNLYCYLKRLGTPTSQSLRYKKDGK